MINKQLVAGYIAQGVSTSAIAAAVGCDESYVSQLRTDPEIIALAAGAEEERTVADVTFDTVLDKAEADALDRIARNIPFANMGQALNAFRVLNSARRRKDGPVQGAGTTVNVTLVMPAHVAPRYVTSANNEIVEVEGKTMVSASPKTIDAILAARSGGTPGLPATTVIEKAAARLGSLAPLPVRAPRKSPLQSSQLSEDML